MKRLLDGWVYPKTAVGHEVSRNYGVNGAPLSHLLWRRVAQRVVIEFRPDTDYDTKLRFLDDLIRSAGRLKMDLLKNPGPDYNPAFSTVEELKAIIATLPKPSMSSAEWDALMNGDDEE